MKKLCNIKSFLITFSILTLLNSCTPVRYIYVDPKDSVVKKQRIIRENIYLETPFFFVRPYYSYPFILPQSPIIIPRNPRIPKRGRH
jgi:hypothetical protein